MDIETSEQLVFIPEQVESIVMAVIDGILRTEIYIEEKVDTGLGPISGCRQRTISPFSRITKRLAWRWRSDLQFGFVKVMKNDLNVSCARLESF